MSSIGWLHISDLHATVRRSAWAAPELRSQFFRDLAELHRVSGPWDLVIVSGDLTMRGASEEFERVDAILDALCAHIQELGSGREPCLLAVPGNHDVSRPSDPSPEAMGSLRRWHEDPQVRNEFWTDSESPARRLVDRALEPYARWWNRRGFPDHVQVHRGLLPGDFAATVEANGIRLGVAGLCSTFLQVTGDDYQERLAVDPLQLTIAARGDVPSWIAEHDAALLVTHHPSHWLAGTPRRAYEETIYPPGRFCAHLSGHLHDDGHGGPAEVMGERVELRAASCLGLPEWETWRGERVERHHGYNACRLELTGADRGLQVWRRSWRSDRISTELGARAPGPDGLPASRFPRLNEVTPRRALERAALRDELHAQYPRSTSEVRRLARRAGVELDPGSGGSAVDLWHVAVVHAEQHGRLDSLVRDALQDHPDALSIRKAETRLQAAASAMPNSRSVRLDELADDLRDRLRLFAHAALSAVLHLSSLPELGPLDNPARAANAAVHEAARRGAAGLARLAAVTTLIADLLGPSETTGPAISALLALELGERALVDGRLPLARKREVTRSPTPATLVKLLGDMFADSTDFDGFVLEHFPAVYRRFTNAMSRDSRARVLVRDADPNTILARLRRDYPSAFASHQRVLEYDTRGSRALASGPSRFA